MRLERYALCGLDIGVVRLDDGVPLVLTGMLGRALGIADGVRVTLDAKARQPCRLRRVRLDDTGRVDTVPLVGLRRYADFLWQHRARISVAAGNKVWDFRCRLARQDNKSTKSDTCDD